MSDDIDSNGPRGSDLAPPPPPPPPPPAHGPRRRSIGRRGATAAVATGLVIGGVAGGYVISQAASPTPSASTTPGAPRHTDGPRGFAGAGPAARTEDLQQIAAAIGITSTQLQTEMSTGKTVAAIAKEHNVGVATVISTLVTDENAEIDTAVKAGTLTTAQATQMKAQTTQRVTDMVNGTAPAHGPGGPRGFGGPGGEDEQVIATAIGITTTQLQTDLAGGKTIATIATAHNVAPSLVISALAASENKEIDQRVSSGEITAAQGMQEKTQTQQRATDEVNGTHPDGGAGPHGGFGGPPPGAPSGSSTTS